MDIGKIKQSKGVSCYPRYPEEVKMDHCYRRLRSALIELAHVVQDMKVSPDKASEHWEMFWGLLEGDDQR